jgi:ABC-type transporter Mla subunit MlaD
MRRLGLIAVALVAAVTIAVLRVNASGADGSPYRITAIFDDASFAVAGEEVRIAGAPVGSIVGLDVTKQKKAAVTLQIDQAEFTPFYANATCSIRPQSLIGEEYVDCDPGASSAPPLPKIPSGPGAGTYLLPVTRTHSPVDVDLVQSISRLPTRQQLTLILNELGTGLAARGSDLNAVIHRANPALGYTDQVFQILARQSRGLAQLATDADSVLGPLAAEKQAISSFITHARLTSDASAERAADIARSFNKLPGFLQALNPLMADLGTLADQATPVFTSLGQSAAGINATFASLGPFAEAAGPALQKLGAAAAASQQPLVNTIPLANQLTALGDQLAPASASLDQLTASLQRTGGIQQLMNTLFYGTTAANGFDNVSHYVRLQLLAGPCSKYQTQPVPGCSANFSSATAAADRPLSPQTKALVRRVAAHARAGLSSTSNATLLESLLRYLIGSGK